MPDTARREWTKKVMNKQPSADQSAAQKKQIFRRNAIIIAVLVLLVCVMLLVLDRKTTIQADANSPTLALEVADVATETPDPTAETTEAPTDVPTDTPEPAETAVPDDAVATATALAATTEVPNETVAAILDNDAQAFLLVTMGNNVYAPIPLTGETYYKLTNGTGVNIVHVTETSINMHEANCDNQDCIEQGEVTLENKDTRILSNMIICLPNQISLQLFSREEIIEWMTENLQEDTANE